MFYKCSILGAVRLDAVQHERRRGVEDLDNSRPSGPFSQAAGTAPRGMEPDIAEYAGELDGLDLTEAQKQELLETLWSIMRSFVEMGLDVDICAALTEGGTDGESAEIE